MSTEIEKMEYLHRVKKDEVLFLLIAMHECESKGFDIKGCNIDIILREDLVTNKKNYIISFYPREVTAENVMEYKILLDDFNVYIDFETKEVMHSCPSI